MKIGIRKPNLKKSIKARTTGRVKRSIKKAINPNYGKKGRGWVKDPKRALYNKIYRKTTFSIYDLLSVNPKRSKHSKGTTCNVSKEINYNIEDRASRSILFLNEDGNIKSCKSGYNWIKLLLPVTYNLFVRDFKGFLVELICWSTVGLVFPDLLVLVWVIYCGLYNKIHMKNLIKKGYKPFDKEYV